MKRLGGSHEHQEEYKKVYRGKVDRVLAGLGAEGGAGVACRSNDSPPSSGACMTEQASLPRVRRYSNLMGLGFFVSIVLAVTGEGYMDSLALAIWMVDVTVFGVLLWMDALLGEPKS